VKELLGFRSIGRDVLESGEVYQLREGGAAFYEALFGPKKDNIDPENTHFLGINNT
jgi:hypothetical protein